MMLLERGTNVDAATKVGADPVASKENTVRIVGLIHGLRLWD
jgi:hypothetical protein